MANEKRPRVVDAVSVGDESVPENDLERLEPPLSRKVNQRLRLVFEEVKALANADLRSELADLPRIVACVPTLCGGPSDCIGCNDENCNKIWDDD